MKGLLKNAGRKLALALAFVMVLTGLPQIGLLKPMEAEAGTAYSQTAVGNVPGEGGTLSAADIEAGTAPKYFGFGSLNLDSKTSNIKMESSTTISFTTTSKMKLTINYQSDAAKKNVKIDGGDRTSELEIELAAGTHTIAKGDTTVIVSIVLTPLTPPATNLIFKKSIDGTVSDISSGKQEKSGKVKFPTVDDTNVTLIFCGWFEEDEKIADTTNVAVPDEETTYVAKYLSKSKFHTVTVSDNAVYTATVEAENKEDTYEGKYYEGATIKVYFEIDQDKKVTTVSLNGIESGEADANVVEFEMPDEDVSVSVAIENAEYSAIALYGDDVDYSDIKANGVNIVAGAGYKYYAYENALITFTVKANYDKAITSIKAGDTELLSDDLTLEDRKGDVEARFTMPADDVAVIATAAAISQVTILEADRFVAEGFNNVLVGAVGDPIPDISDAFSRPNREFAGFYLEEDCTTKIEEFQEADVEVYIGWTQKEIVTDGILTADLIPDHTKTNAANGGLDLKVDEDLVSNDEMFTILAGTNIEHKIEGGCSVSDRTDIWANSDAIIVNAPADCDAVKITVNAQGSGDPKKGDVVVEGAHRTIGIKDEAGEDVAVKQVTKDAKVDLVATVEPGQKYTIYAGCTDPEASKGCYIYSVRVEPVVTYAVAVAEGIEHGTVAVDGEAGKKYSKGDKVTLTVTPAEGYLVDFVKFAEADKDAVEVKKATDGKYTFTMPDGAVTVTAAFFDKTLACTVTFDCGGKATVAAQTIVSGRKATKPADPRVTGYKFDGWYADAEFTTAFDFTKAIEADTTVYGKFSEKDTTTATLIASDVANANGDCGTWASKDGVFKFVAGMTVQYTDSAGASVARTIDGVEYSSRFKTAGLGKKNPTEAKSLMINLKGSGSITVVAETGTTGADRHVALYDGTGAKLKQESVVTATTVVFDGLKKGTYYISDGGEGDGAISIYNVEVEWLADGSSEEDPDITDTPDEDGLVPITAKTTWSVSKSDYDSAETSGTGTSAKQVIKGRVLKADKHFLVISTKGLQVAEQTTAIKVDEEEFKYTFKLQKSTIEDNCIKFTTKAAADVTIAAGHGSSNVEDAMTVSVVKANGTEVGKIDFAKSEKKSETIKLPSAGTYFILGDGKSYTKTDGSTTSGSLNFVKVTVDPVATEEGSGSGDKPGTGEGDKPGTGGNDKPGTGDKPGTDVSGNVIPGKIDTTNAVIYFDPIPVQAYTGAKVTPVIKAYYGDNKGNFVTLTAGKDYAVSYKDNVNEGEDTAKAIVKLKGNYDGTTTLYFSIKKAEGFDSATALKGAKVVIDPQTYTGSEIVPSKITLKIKNAGDVDVTSEDFDVAFEKNVAKGKATVYVTGKGNKYKGSVKGAFTINAADISKATLTPNTDITAKLMKGGAVLPSTISYNGIALKNGVDYTVSYKNNKASGTTAIATIKGKGSFTGKMDVNFKVVDGDLSEAKITADDIAFSDKKGKFMSKVAVATADGKKLSNKEYTLEYKVCDKDGNVAADAASLTKNDAVAAGTEYIKVTASAIEGKGYTGKCETIYHMVDKNLLLKSAKVIASNQEYNGSAVTITKGDLVVSLGKGASATELTPNDFEILEDSYVKNTGKGTAKVTIRGIGKYAGTKVVSFKIVPQSNIK